VETGCVWRHFSQLKRDVRRQKVSVIEEKSPLTVFVSIILPIHQATVSRQPSYNESGKDHRVSPHLDNDILLSLSQHIEEFPSVIRAFSSPQEPRHLPPIILGWNTQRPE